MDVEFGQFKPNVGVQLTLETPIPTFQKQHFRRSLYASIYLTQWIENDVSARLPNISVMH